MNTNPSEHKSNTISMSISESFHRMWDMYSDALDKIPETHWRTGTIDYLIPARLMYHILEGVDFLSNPSYQDFMWGHRFKVRWEHALPEHLPSKDHIREYLKEMIDKVDQWLNNLSEADLLAAEHDFSWAGSSKHGRALYLLTHCH
ncbi:MAG: hypothetical protein ACFFCU_07525, partial [Promethearchaeota archaeon]